MHKNTAEKRFNSPLRWAHLLAVAAILLSASQAWADTADDMHSALKQRWYTTEIVIFRNLKAPANESLLLEGKRVSVAVERRQGTQAEQPGDNANNVLTLGGQQRDPFAATTNVFGDDNRGDDKSGDDNNADRPALDAEPWESIRDYDAETDLGELVARNMATWETQLRAQDGELLRATELQLGEAVTRLKRTRNLEVLLHSGWVQAVPARDAGEPVQLSAGDSFADARDGSLRSRLEGEVTVTLGRYLHVHPTLFYTAASNLTAAEAAVENPTSAVAQARAAAATARSSRTPEVRDLSSSSALDRLRDRKAAQRSDAAPEDSFAATNVAQNLPPYIRLDQSRRLRSSELHYIDHPELGVLVRITPVVAPALLQEQFTLLQ